MKSKLERHLLAVLACAAVVALSLLLPDSLTTAGKIALAVTALAIVGWTLTPIPDSIVAVSAALLLVMTGVLPEKQLYSALGSELIWLLVASFVIAAIVKGSGLMERFAFAAVRPFSGIVAFFHAIAAVIALTAFLIPSTSGRAALLLPVFVALADRMPGRQSERALALLFPTVILLSAGGSIIGAGAHFIVVESVQRAAGVSIGYLEWLMLAFPLTFLASHLAVALIVAMFVPKEERAAKLHRKTCKPSPLTSQQLRIATALAGIVALWITTPWHGVDVAIVAVGGAVLLLTNLFSSEKPKQVFRHVEVELLVFLAATVVVADGIILSGASKWMAARAMELLPQDATRSLPIIVVFLTCVAVLSHLVINSRSARAAVLIPALALPLAGFGHDVTILALVTVLGTGFCQTMMASAKPVAIFGNAERQTFNQADLFRLALPLLPIKAAIIIVFALFVWPHQLPPGHGRIAELKPLAAAHNAAPPERRPAVVEATCSRARLQTLMLATIRKNHMWASGWWHVWKRLRRDGYRVERNAVKQIYRAEKMVRLRSYSRRLAAPDLDPGAVPQAAKGCR